MLTDSVVYHHPKTAVPTPIPAIQPPSVETIRENTYQYYRAFLSTLINMNSPSLNTKTFICNNLYNTGMNGKHERFIHFGRAVADLSVGQLEFPWTGADCNRNNETPLLMFERFAASETNPIVSQRLWMLSQFIRSLQEVPRIFLYKSPDCSVVSVTLVDDINEIKFNYMPTEFGV